MYNKQITHYGLHHSGYLYFCDKKHPLADVSGIVFLHRHVMSIHIGRWISSEEYVHHKDENKLNNDPSNLELLTHLEHYRIHKGYRKKDICVRCGKPFLVITKGQRSCSKECRLAQRRKFEVEREELYKLVWVMPTTEVAKLFGVSGKAIEKRCKLLGVSKPPRGYWNKIKAGVPVE